MAEEVQIVHDPDWVQFPEVAEAVKRASSLDECTSIATCPSKGKWAVGLGSGWQSRERSAKVALSLAIAVDDPRLMQLVNQYPEFGMLCANAGVVPPSMGMPPMGMKGPGCKGFGKDPWGAGGAGWGSDPFGKGSLGGMCGLGGMMGSDPFGSGKGASCGGKDPWGKGDPFGGGQDPFGQGGWGAPAPKAPKAPKRPSPQSWSQGPQGPRITWLTLDGNSKLVAQAGFPAEAPAVSHSKAHAEAFRSSHHILTELVGSLQDQVQFTHDADWVEFPEVAAALQAAGGEEDCYCIASCPAQGKWAVGVASGWKNRELASKFALCVALLNDSDMLDTVCAQYPDFAGYLAEAGMGGGAAAANKRRKTGVVVTPADAWGKGGGDAAAAWSGPIKPFGGAGGGWADLGQASNLPSTPTAWPKDTPLWIELPPEKEAPAILKDFPRDALAVGTDGNNRRELYDSADGVLAQLLKGEEANIGYFDDPNWEQFPEIGNTLKAHGPDADTAGPSSVDEQLTLAVTKSGNAWSVGFGSDAASRNQAAKIALGVTLTLRAAEVPDLDAFPNFAEFIGEVKVQKSA